MSRKNTLTGLIETSIGLIHEKDAKSATAEELRGKLDKNGIPYDRIRSNGIDR